MKFNHHPVKYNTDDYVGSIHFFHTEYEEIPFRKVFYGVRINKLFKKWDKKYTKEIYTQEFTPDKKGVGRSIFILADGVIGFISKDYANDQEVQILYKRSIPEQDLKPFIKEVKSCFRKKGTNENKIEILFQEGQYTNFKSFDVKEIEINIATNYNDDFLPIHTLIQEKLSTKDANGLVILYGDPGTGKTHYLRYLSSVLEKKKLFIPSNMASSLANPDFLSKLEENKGSVLIIEDADDILSRKGDGNTAVANLLNLSDGLLADVLSIQIICTFNSSITVIDDALLRKGRVIAKYEFKALAKEKAQALSDKLGFKHKIKEDTRLSDIYNPEDEDFSKKQNKIGF